MVVLGCQVMPDGGPPSCCGTGWTEALDYLEDHPDLTVVVSGARGTTSPPPRPGAWRTT